MDLKCLEVVCENPDTNYADNDKHISRHSMVLRNLLALERSTVPNVDYFRHIQPDVKPYMRKIVTTWMLEVCTNKKKLYTSKKFCVLKSEIQKIKKNLQVCDEQRCEEQIFPLAVNFMDRFLCVCAISRQQLQLVGTVCLLLATKLRQCHALTVDLLCAYTDNSVTPDQLRVSCI